MTPKNIKTDPLGLNTNGHPCSHYAFVILRREGGRDVRYRDKFSMAVSGQTGTTQVSAKSCQKAVISAGKRSIGQLTPALMGNVAGIRTPTAPNKNCVSRESI